MPRDASPVRGDREWWKYTMQSTNRILTCLAGLWLMASGGFAFAADDAAVPEAPAMPPKVESGEVLEPEIHIIETKEGTHEEYSVNGRVYMVKITPVVGPAYYLMDTNGDGELDTRGDHPADVGVVPQWVLLSW